MDRPLLLHPEASRYQQALLLALGGLALCALWACVWPWPVSAVASLLLLAAIAWHWRLIQSPPVQAVAWHRQPGQRSWEILQDGAWAAATLSGPVVVTGLLTVLSLQPATGRPLTLALWPDSAAPEALRQLRLILLAPGQRAPKEKGT